MTDGSGIKYGILQDAINFSQIIDEILKELENQAGELIQVFDASGWVGHGAGEFRVYIDMIRECCKIYREAFSCGDSGNTWLLTDLKTRIDEFPQNIDVAKMWGIANG